MIAKLHDTRTWGHVDLPKRDTGHTHILKELQLQKQNINIKMENF